MTESLQEKSRFSEAGKDVAEGAATGNTGGCFFIFILGKERYGLEI